MGSGRDWKVLKSWKESEEDCWDVLMNGEDEGRRERRKSRGRVPFYTEGRSGFRLLLMMLVGCHWRN